MTVSWTDTTIDGRKCATANIRDKRLYVCERFGRVEAWVDGVRVGNFADLYEAKVAVLRIRRPAV